jgi:hypothetical protein
MRSTRIEQLLERETIEPNDLPGTHPGVYREAAATGIFSESIANDLADLWRDHRAKTYYQDGLAAAERAEAMSALAVYISRLEFVCPDGARLKQP